MFPRTISTRISLFAGGLALVGVSTLSFILIRAHRVQVIEEVVHGCDSVAETIRLSITHDMLMNTPDGVRQVIQSVGKHSAIEGIRLFNKEGKITYSSRPEDVGRVVDKRAEACYQCHDADAPIGHLPAGDRSRTYTDVEGRKILATITVIPNEEGCHPAGCHPEPEVQSVLGVLDVAVLLDPVEKRLLEATGDALLISGVAIIIISGALFLAIRRSVRRPVRRLIEATRRVAAGDYKHQVRPHATDEIGFLASSFNEMIERLDSSHSHLEASVGGLSDLVTQKARELREAQFQVVQAEKLSSVGLVAAGIAHELNSPLMAIMTFAHMVQKTCPKETQEYEDLEMVLREARRCASIIKNLLEFSRDQKEGLKLEPCDVAELVDRCFQLVKPEFLGCGVETHISIPPDLPRVKGDTSQLQQVMVNLMLNAVHAMPKGGELVIRGGLANPEDYSHLESPTSLGDGHIRISFRDTGHGIRPEDIGKVFDPFFTTKETGQGFGLGLSVSHGIITRHGGAILVKSDGSSGAEFTLLLPGTSSPPASRTG